MSGEEADLITWAQEVCGHKFCTPTLLEEALTHATFAHEHGEAHSNERLEFLGDAVVGMTIADYLFAQCPESPEGELTKMRAAVVCESALADRSRHLHIARWMRFGRGGDVSGRDSILADAFEALVGALYLDGGWEVARRFILQELGPLVEKARSGRVRGDYKTLLQEKIQRYHPESPVYKLLAEEGPPHNKRFHVGVYHQGNLLGSGWGRNKKAAEQEAARQAIEGFRS